MKKVYLPFLMKSKKAKKKILFLTSSEKGQLFETN